MPQRDDQATLRQMLQHTVEVISLTSEQTKDGLEQDRVLSLAIVRLLEIVGEAATRVSSEKRQESPQIPWNQIISLRNRLIHAYDSVDMDILWQILSGDLPVLMSELQELID